HFLSETPFDFWLALACGCTVAAFQQRRLRWDVLAGACWGMALLTRPVLLFALPIAWLLAVLALVRSRTPLFQVAVQTALLLVVIAPWVARNAIVLGKADVAVGAGGYSFWGSHNDVIWNDPQWCGFWINTTRLEDAEHPLVGTEAERDAAAWH